MKKTNKRRQWSNRILFVTLINPRGGLGLRRQDLKSISINKFTIFLNIESWPIKSGKCSTFIVVYIIHNGKMFDIYCCY